MIHGLPTCVATHHRRKGFRANWRWFQSHLDSWEYLFVRRGREDRQWLTRKDRKETEKHTGCCEAVFKSERSRVSAGAHFESHCPEGRASGQVICFPFMGPSSVSPQSSVLVNICPFALLTLIVLPFCPYKCVNHSHSVWATPLPHCFFQRLHCAKGRGGGETRQWTWPTLPQSGD